MKAWFGGYTKKSSQGIYRANFQQNQLETPSLIVPVQNATYFQISKNNELFTIIKEGDLGGLAYYDLKDDAATLVDKVLAAGSPPAYVGLNEDEKLIYVANYHLALLQVYSYADHKLKLVAETKHEDAGHGPRPEQTTSHPHFFDRTPAHNLVSVDLGLDQVDFYKLEGQELKHLATYHNEAGFGSRHIVFHPTKPVMYVVGELSSNVNVVKYDETDFNFESIATYSTLPETFTGANGASAIKISADGKFLYAANRGHDSIVVYAINENDATLSVVQHIKVAGSFPRDFNWTKDQDLVVVANQNTDNATVFTRNATTGFLTEVQKDVVVPEATRVQITED